MNKRYAGKFLAALSAVLLFCGIAAAEIVYTTADFATWTGELGVIDGDFAVAPVPLSAPLTSDTGIFHFYDEKGNSRVAVVERDYETGDTVRIFDPKNWEVLFNEKWTGAINIYDIVASDNMLYAACNGSWTGGGGSKIAQISMTDYKLTGKSYSCPDSDGYTSHAERALVIGGSVYALFSRVKGDYPSYEFAKSKLVKLTEDLVQLSDEDEYEVGENAMDMIAVNDGNGIVVAYAGGPQMFGTIGGLDIFHTKADVTRDRVESLSKDKNLIENQMIMNVCYVNAHLYFIGQRYETEDGIWPVSTLYRWTGPADADNPIKEVKDISNSEGTSYQVAFDKKNDKIVTLAGNKILVFNRKDTLQEEFDEVDLGGSPYALTLLDTASGGSGGGSDDGGSGCSAGPAAFAVLLLVLPLALRRRSR